MVNKIDVLKLYKKETTDKTLLSLVWKDSFENYFQLFLFVKYNFIF